MFTVLFICAVIRRGRRLVYSVALDGPIEDKLMLKAASQEEVSEKLLVLIIVRCLFELELATVCHVLSELLYLKQS